MTWGAKFNPLQGIMNPLARHRSQSPQTIVGVLV
jgi:hypothetical protein